MDQTLIISLMNKALMTVLIISAPALLIAIVIGLGVGLLQALTQIQDQTLPQAVKLVAVLFSLIFGLPLLAGQVSELADLLLAGFPLWTRERALRRIYGGKGRCYGWVLRIRRSRPHRLLWRVAWGW